MKKIDVYEAKKRIIDQVKIPDMEQYDIRKILYSVIWRMVDLTPFQKWIRAVAYLVFKTFHISILDDHAKNDKLAIEIESIKEISRADNKLIFSNMYGYLKPCGHLLIQEKYKYKLDIKSIVYRAKLFIVYINSINKTYLCDRAFLAANLVMAKSLIDFILKEKIFDGCQFILLFQDHERIENVLAQTARLQGGKVITPQHSMPMNRHEDYDQLFFDCFSADYKLCWNEATKLQFLSAGIDEEKLVVVGNTKKMYMPLVNRSQKKTYNALGVLLDGPHVDQGIENNKALIMIAAKLATEFGLDCVVKLHPFDKKENYLSKIRSSFTKVSILDAGTTMEQYEELVDFSLGHTTGAMLDLIYDNCFVFQYKTEIEFPIETDDIYIFHDYEELKRNYLKWKEHYEFYKIHNEDIVKKYRVENPIELHNRFFQTLF